MIVCLFYKLYVCFCVLLFRFHTLVFYLMRLSSKVIYLPGWLDRQQYALAEPKGLHFRFISSSKFLEQLI